MNAQVTSVEYLIEYNESTTFYDCKIVIIEGEAISYMNRIQFNAQYTIEVPTGTEIDIVEYHNPFRENQNYTGTEPMEWEFGYNLISPVEKPESDFYIIDPNLGATAAYNNIYEGDTITLFSLSVDIDPCENAVRPHENDLELEYFDLISGIFDNGFTIGSPNQLYNGNLSTIYGATVSANDSKICLGITTFVSSNTQGTWQNNDVSILSIDPNTGVVVGVGEGIGTITFTDLITGCTSNDIMIEVLSISDPSCIVGTQDFQETEIKVYPNPVSELFHIEAGSDIQKIIIYSLDSKIVFVDNYLDSQKSRTISVVDHKLDKGLYIIEVIMEGKKISKRLVVE